MRKVVILPNKSRGSCLQGQVANCSRTIAVSFDGRALLLEFDEEQVSDQVRGHVTL